MKDNSVVFKGPANHLVRVMPGSPVHKLPRAIRFDNKGFYECTNKYLAKRLDKKFDRAIKYKCKHCEFETNNKGSLAAHYRVHAKEKRELEAAKKAVKTPKNKKPEGK